MHQWVSDVAKTKNEAARLLHNRKHGVSPVNFEIGDFVLSGNVIRRTNKRILHWKGPYRVVATLNVWTYDIQELVEPFAIITRHVTRLKFYSEEDLEITQV
uniref:AlNc14C205G8784 protein n=1 Tax=Albugo laibachii Nc14 TaxID=890382 RepID=F0WQX4_9STRA|nr:AlNc14C205G8784 [Albugo laibachii Nc14]|eukprot:CCA23734.1 AlNc14C205G8784 [Albugo laibachii Nc14]